MRKFIKAVAMKAIDLYVRIKRFIGRNAAARRALYTLVAAGSVALTLAIFAAPVVALFAWTTWPGWSIWLLYVLVILPIYGNLAYLLSGGM